MAAKGGGGSMVLVVVVMVVARAWQVVLPWLAQSDRSWVERLGSTTQFDRAKGVVARVYVPI
jgi:hypothetical protein